MSLQGLIENDNENQILEFLLPYFDNNIALTQQEKEILLGYSAVDFVLLGLIGLLTQDVPRILLGKVCHHTQIREKCRAFKHDLSHLQTIADTYMEVEHSEADEFVYRNVMLIYPRDRVDVNGQLK
ncbi:MAG: hypothetical protein JXQ87_05270 [Bacteroidia bacterium]